MEVVEASVTRASGAVTCRYARRVARARLALKSSKAVMSPAVHVTGTLNSGAGKDVVKRGLNGCCVGGTPVEI